MARHIKKTEKTEKFVEPKPETIKSLLDGLVEKRKESGRDFEITVCMKSGREFRGAATGISGGKVCSTLLLNLCGKKTAGTPKAVYICVDDIEALIFDDFEKGNSGSARNAMYELDGDFPFPTKSELAKRTEYVSETLSKALGVAVNCNIYWATVPQSDNSFRNLMRAMNAVLKFFVEASKNEVLKTKISGYVNAVSFSDSSLFGFSLYNGNLICELSLLDGYGEKFFSHEIFHELDKLVKTL